MRGGSRDLTTQFYHYYPIYNGSMSPLWITALIALGAILLLLSDRLRPDLVALLTALALGLTGVLTVQETFSGFSRSAVIIILSIFVLADGLKRCRRGG